MQPAAFFLLVLRKYINNIFIGSTYSRKQNTSFTLTAALKSCHFICNHAIIKSQFFFSRHSLMPDDIERACKMKTINRFQIYKTQSVPDFVFFLASVLACRLWMQSVKKKSFNVCFKYTEGLFIRNVLWERRTSILCFLISIQSCFMLHWMERGVVIHCQAPRCRWR